MNILLTSAGRRTYLINYFKEALADNGKVFAANSHLTYSLSQADEYVLTPTIYSDDYIPFLLKLCKSKKIDVLVSLFDIDLPILSKNIQEFSNNGTKLIVSSEEVIDVCNDKWKTFNFLIDNGLPTPLTFIDKEMALRAIDQKQLSYPVIVKPRWGMGSIGIYKAESFEELEVFYRKIQRDIANSYLKYESRADLNNSILIQQCITGDEFGIEVVNDLEGRYVNTLCKHKVAMRSGETDEAKTVSNDELSEIGYTLSNRLNHVAMLDVDCLEQDGKFYVLELNARFGGQYPFSHLAGANIPKQIIDWCNEKPTNKDLVTIDYDVVSAKDILPVLK
ncbi:ATP-grasp domain-containing protein [Vibrio breoganii]